MSLINVVNAYKRFGENEVLRGVDLDIEDGEMVAIIGRSGSGKSTLLRCFNRLEQLNGGAIHFKGGNIQSKDTDLRELRREIGMVFQSFNLFPHLNVRQNITLAPTLVNKMDKDQAAKVADEVLAQVGLSDKAEAYPDQLSGGQKQRVAIARALAMSPSVMLFDEVTSALDPELTAEVLKVMEQLSKQGMTMILVTHEMNFARRMADRVVFMHHGKVWEQGVPAQLFDSPQTPELQAFLQSEL